MNQRLCFLLLMVNSHFLVEAFAPTYSRTNKMARICEMHPRVSSSTLKIDPCQSILKDRMNKGLKLWRRDDEAPLEEAEGPGLYDLIVVGSGNGACAFLEQCLEFNKKQDLRILVLEQGQNFFFTSDVTHQNGWSKTYSTGSIFKLHNSLTPSGRPVLAGRACTMGGGGSINYTMIHESSKWLAKNLGHDEKYWDKLKKELNEKFERPDPFDSETPFCQYIQEKAVEEGHYMRADPNHLTGNIPSYQDGDGGAKQLYIFPTQFNEHGQRTNSGVSLVDWRDPRLYLKVNREVKELIFEEGSDGSDSVCSGVKVKNSKTATNCGTVVLRHAETAVSALESAESALSIFW